MTTLVEYATVRAIGRGDPREAAVRMVQGALHEGGAELIIDGDFGGITEAAVRAVQASHGLALSGRVGTTTGAILDAQIAGKAAAPSPLPLPSAQGAAPWLSVMRAITGERELPGNADSPFVLGMAKYIGAKYPDLRTYSADYTHDAIPWCGLCTAYVMAMSDVRPVSRSDGAEFGYLWADDWKYFGKACDLRVGAVGVFTRNGGGHVSLIEGIGDGFVYIRGGNQSDMINVIKFSVSKLTTTRWPAGWPVADVPGITTAAAAGGSTR